MNDYETFKNIFDKNKIPYYDKTKDAREYGYFDIGYNGYALEVNDNLFAFKEDGTLWFITKNY